MDRGWIANLPSDLYKREREKEREKRERERRREREHYLFFRSVGTL